MRYFIILFLTIICCFSVSGNPQKDALNYHYVQLKVINLSDTDIDFYYNNLNRINTHLNIGQEEITYKTPITDDYPGFIAIDRGNSDLEIYTKTYINEIAVPFYYIILINNNRIDFYEVSDINDNYLKLNENQNRSLYWRRIELNKNNITIKITNHTGESITIISNGYLFRDNNQTTIIGEGTKESGSINLENEAHCLYVIDSEIFSLKYIFFTILYTRIYTNQGKTSWYRPNDKINLNNQKQRNITVILNGYDIGYEIKFE